MKLTSRDRMMVLYNRRLFRFNGVALFVLIALIDSSAQENSFNIVGLVHEENTQAEMAFRYGIERFNMYKSEIRYNASVRRVSTYDTFETSKLVCSLTSEESGIIAIFGPESLTTASMVQSISSNLNIPHIQTNWKPTATTLSSTILNMYPDPDLLAQALATLVKHMDWRSYTILYESNDGLIRLQEVFKLARSDSIPVTLRQLPIDADYRSLFKELKYAKETRIVIDCATDNILRILQQAKEVEMLDYYHSYLFTNLDAHLVDFKLLDTNANITLIRLVDPDNPNLDYVIRDWEMGELTRNRHRNIVSTEITTEAALMADAISHFTAAFRDLYASDEIAADSLDCQGEKIWESGVQIVNYMKIRPLVNAITGNVRFDDFGQRTDFTLQIVEVLEGRIEKIGTWTPEQLDHIIFLRSAHEQMQQIVQTLQKTTVIVSSRIGSPYLMRKEPTFEGQQFEGNDQYEGYSLDLIDGISKELNFTFRFELAADGKYGNYVPENGTWNGLIKDLIDRKAHLAICDLTITHQRREAVDFSLPFMTLGVSILYSKSKPSERNIFAFMEPLDNTVWIYIMSSYVSVTLIMFCVTRMAPGDWEDPNPMSNETAEELENIWTFKNCLWLVLGSTMSQGCDMLPKGISSRMAASMWWFFILIISSSYTANLAAFLTMDKMAPSIDSAEALSKQTKIKYGTVNGGSTQTFFRESNFSTYQRMWTQMETFRPSVFEKSNADGVKRVLTTKNQGYAFLMESSSIEYEIERNCDLKQVGGRMDSKGYGIAMPVNSPYRSAINTAVLKMQEEGKLAILKNKWWKEMHGGGACDDDVGDGSSGAELQLANVGGVFLVLGISVAVAFVFCLIDLAWNIHKITVKQHVTYKEALRNELVFAIKVWKTEKPIGKEPSGGSIDNISTSVKLGTSKSRNNSDNNKSVNRTMKDSINSDTSCTQTI